MHVPGNIIKKYGGSLSTTGAIELLENCSCCFTGHTEHIEWNKPSRPTTKHMHTKKNFTKLFHALRRCRGGGGYQTTKTIRYATPPFLLLKPYFSVREMDKVIIVI